MPDTDYDPHHVESAQAFDLFAWMSPPQRASSRPLKNYETSVAETPETASLVKQK